MGRDEAEAEGDGGVGGGTSAMFPGVPVGTETSPIESTPSATAIGTPAPPV